VAAMVLNFYDERFSVQPTVINGLPESTTDIDPANVDI
jgi:hypothetical protein